MKEIIISSSLPEISGNFEEIKSELTEQLKQFDLVVDADSVKTAKSMVTQINKLSGEIDKKRKQIVAELSAPIKEFEAQMKELKSLCQDSRQNLLSQVKVYDEKKLDEVKTLLQKELQAKYTHYGVKEEFQKVTIDDLIILSHLTQGGALAKKARDAVNERVGEAKKLQEKIDTRLLTLEAICFKSGLTAPLTRENINHFLMVESDDEYLDKLTSLIKNELDRLEQAKVREQEVTKQQQVVQQNHSSVSTPTLQHQSRKEAVKRVLKNAQEFAPEPTKRKFVVTASFEIEFDDIEGIEEKLQAMMLKKFVLGGFKTTPNVVVEKLT